LRPVAPDEPEGTTEGDLDTLLSPKPRPGTSHPGSSPNGKFKFYMLISKSKLSSYTYLEFFIKNYNHTFLYIHVYMYL
jgi:hypothetical protein